MQNSNIYTHKEILLSIIKHNGKCSHLPIDCNNSPKHRECPLYKYCNNNTLILGCRENEDTYVKKEAISVALKKRYITQEELFDTEL